MHGSWKTNERGHGKASSSQTALSANVEYALVCSLLDDFPAFPITNVWTDTATGGFSDDPKIYVVQTNTKVIERCMLMTTDPGDLGA